MGVYVSKGGCILLYLLNIVISVIIKETVLLADFRHCFDRLSVIRQGQRSVTYESDVQVDHVSITARTQADCCCQTGRRLAKWTLPENRCPRTPSTARAFASCQTQNSSGLGDQSLLSWQASAESRGRDALAALRTACSDGAPKPPFGSRTSGTQRFPRARRGHIQQSRAVSHVDSLCSKNGKVFAGQSAPPSPVCIRQSLTPRRPAVTSIAASTYPSCQSKKDPRTASWRLCRSSQSATCTWAIPGHIHRGPSNAQWNLGMTKWRRSGINRSSLRDDLLVPIAYKTMCKSISQPEMLVCDALVRPVPWSSGPLHSMWSNTNPSAAASESTSTPHKNYETSH